jgi:hypothetical protein
VAVWLDRESKRRRIALDDPHLVQDTDPRAWMPRGGRRTETAALADAPVTANDMVIR